jgi:hypothetical protein
MKLSLLYRCIVTDKNGKIVRRTRWRKSRSFVLQFLKFIEHEWTHAYDTNLLSTSLQNISNAAVSLNNGTGASAAIRRFCIFAPVNTSAYGIVVGTGTTPPTNSDYALATIIAHGVGAGQLNYGASSYTGADVVGSNVDFILTRTFYNGSGANITVNEIGIYAESMSTAGVAEAFCVIRDVITAVTVANTQTLTVQYTLRTTV